MASDAEMRRGEAAGGGPLPRPDYDTEVWRRRAIDSDPDEDLRRAVEKDRIRLEAALRARTLEGGKN